MSKIKIRALYLFISISIFQTVRSGHQILFALHTTRMHNPPLDIGFSFLHCALFVTPNLNVRIN